MRTSAFPSSLAMMLAAVIGLVGMAIAGGTGTPAGATSGTWESPSGTIELEITIEEHLTLPTVVEVTVTQTQPAQQSYPTQNGTAGNLPNTCNSFGPITLADGYRYRIHNGKHQWQNPAWSGDKWQNMYEV